MYESQEASSAPVPARRTIPIRATAALSIAILMIAIGLQFGQRSAPNTLTIPLQNRDPVSARQYLEIEDADGNNVPDWQDELTRAGVVLNASSSEATTTDALSSVVAQIAGTLYGGYLNLKKYDAYTPARGDELAATALSSVRANISFTPHTVDELILDEDSSEKRVLSYRSDMREALEPMVTNDLPEIEYIAGFISTKDVSWLEPLRIAGERYRKAEKNMLALAVPREAAPEHLRVLNSVGEYAAVLEHFAAHPVDGLESVGILQNYNDAEEEMLESFNALAQYYVRTIANK